MESRPQAFVDGRAQPSAQRALKVGVLVDLPLGPRAGGHVRRWERLAQAALGFGDALDLTVHFITPSSAATGGLASKPDKAC